MAETLRKKSPRAPSLGLEEALSLAGAVYDRERLHPAPSDVVAQALGYKSANNGSALSAIASLRYLGLVERPKDGFLAVTKNYEIYRFAPDDATRSSTLIAFLTAPPLYKELLEKYQTGLPSVANLRFELIQKGFSPQSAESALGVFMSSVEFANYYAQAASSSSANSQEDGDTPLGPRENGPSAPQSSYEEQEQRKPSLRPEKISDNFNDESADKIPVRLRGGRKAWLIIPTPLFEADKARIKAQIDLLLTEEED